MGSYTPYMGTTDYRLHELARAHARTRTCTHLCTHCTCFPHFPLPRPRGSTPGPGAGEAEAGPGPVHILPLYAMLPQVGESRGGKGGRGGYALMPQAWWGRGGYALMPQVAFSGGAPPSGAKPLGTPT